MRPLYRFGAMQTCCLSTRLTRLRGRFLRSLLCLTFFLSWARAHASFQTLWLIGNEDNPVQYSLAPRNGFSWFNANNDPAPGQVTRLPGDPQCNPTNNPRADDDFYMAGFYPSGFNFLTDHLTVSNTEPNSAFKSKIGTDDSTNRIHFI